MNFDRQRVQEVGHDACAKLVSIGRFETAAEMFESIGMTEQAVKTYLKGELFERAKQSVAGMQGPKAGALQEMVDKAHKAYLKRENKAEELLQ